MKRFLFGAAFLILGMLALPGAAHSQTYQTTCPQNSSVTSWGSARNGSTGAILQNFCIDSNGNAILNFPYAQTNGCTQNGGVAYENGTANQLTCNANNFYNPAGTSFMASQSGSDLAQYEFNLGLAGHPKIQWNVQTGGPLGASFELDAAAQEAHFGFGGTNYATAIDALAKGVGFPIAHGGTYRMSKQSSDCWRNNADTADNCLSENAADQLTYNGSIISGIGSAFNSGAVIATTTQVSGLTQNNTLLASFYLPSAVATLSNVYYDATLADNTANLYDIGLYGPNCLNGATGVPLVFHTGPLAGTVLFSTTGAQHVALAGAPATVNMTPGWYCWAYTSSGAAPNGRFGGETAAIHVGMFGNAGVAPGGGTGATTGATLNSTITAPALNVINLGYVWVAGY